MSLASESCNVCKEKSPVSNDTLSHKCRAVHTNSCSLYGSNVQLTVAKATHKNFIYVCEIFIGVNWI